ncbi:alpha/beta hydrolase [Rhodoferax sp.]|uniref:alpha/beta fold hydrolase n=1 Tax=Rhodoferax sp. TaxID=50421 RepID=UPI00283FF163|nr:alpha/beta hydrolase [Rhodoferax sp.]MDR3370241.1 alpha/beta hydrolase [Rhodoferax sp.]
MKPTLVLLPGLMCDAAVWAPQIESLSDLVDCAVVDYGLRDSITAMARLVLDSTALARFALAGHSMGGRVALEVMRLAPERVERLALLDTGTHPLAQGEAGAKERAGRMALVELARDKGMRVMGQQWLPGMVHPDVIGSALFESVLEMLECSSPEQFSAQINALLTRPDAAPGLSAITCPTLVLTGEHDVWSPPAQHAAMAQVIASAQLCIVPHSGHMSTLEQPEAVSSAMRQWMLR